MSTNAGGLRVLKYGMTRGLVLGLEAVLSNGEVISSMKKVIKDKIPLIPNHPGVYKMTKLNR